MSDSKHFEAYLQKLPVIPDVAAKVIGIAEGGKHISFQELENIIKVDPGLTAKILKVANSALYARQNKITTLQMAITLLGFKNIKSLVILTTASNLFSKSKNAFFYTQFWRHSVMSAFISKEIIIRNHKKISEDEGFLAGLLHDIGQVAMFHADNENYLKIIELRNNNGTGTKDLEDQYYNTTHKQIGAQVLSSWNFPKMYVDTAKEHGMVNIVSEHRQLILAVSIADILSDILVFGGVHDEKGDLLEQFAHLSDLDNKEIEYYKTDYVSKLTKEPLFTECQDLFNFSYSENDADTASKE